MERSISVTDRVEDEIIARMILEKVSQRQKARAKEQAGRDIEAEGVLALLLGQIVKETQEAEILARMWLADVAESLEVSESASGVV